MNPQYDLDILHTSKNINFVLISNYLVNMERRIIIAFVEIGAKVLWFQIESIFVVEFISIYFNIVKMIVCASMYQVSVQMHDNICLLRLMYLVFSCHDMEIRGM